jgi:hypothetical protein
MAGSPLHVMVESISGCRTILTLPPVQITPTLIDPGEGITTRSPSPLPPTSVTSGRPASGGDLAIDGGDAAPLDFAAPPPELFAAPCFA